MDLKNVLYTCILLNATSVEILKEAADRMRSAVLTNIHCHHVTLKFKPMLGDMWWLKDRIGEEVRFGLDNNIMYNNEVSLVVPNALSLSVFDDIVDSGYPHITLATADGIPPKNSLYLLTGNGEYLNEPYYFSDDMVGVISVVNRDGSIIN